MKAKTVHIRIAVDELDAIRAAAEAEGETLSAFLRAAALSAADRAPFFSHGELAELNGAVVQFRAVGRNLNTLLRSTHFKDHGAVPEGPQPRHYAAMRDEVMTALAGLKTALAKVPQ